jgi:hypothetical protein
MPIYTTYIQLEVDIHYEIDPPELGLPEQVDIQSVTVTTGPTGQDESKTF